jgi:hypothetical protein
MLGVVYVTTGTGHMRPSTAAALVGAAVLSTLIFPILGLRLRGDLAAQDVATARVGLEEQKRRVFDAC